VQAADIHPDGWQIASIGLDSTVKIWDFAPLPEEPKSAPAARPNPAAQSERIQTGLGEQRSERLKADAEAYRTLLATRNTTPFLRFGFGMVLLDMGQANEAVPHLLFGVNSVGTGGAQRSQLAKLLLRQSSLETFHRLLNEGSDYNNLVEIAFQTAAHALLDDKQEAYEQVCRTMRMYDQRLALRGRGVMEIRAWTLIPTVAASEQDLMRLVQNVLTENNVSLTTERPNDRQMIALHCAAMVHLRCGRSEEAIRYAEAALRSPRFPELNHVVLALAHHNLGTEEKARSHLKQAAREPTNSPVDAHAHRILHHEALGLIE
jgi:predicted Zn-dependent protease